MALLDRSGAGPALLSAVTLFCASGREYTPMRSASDVLRQRTHAHRRPVRSVVSRQSSRAGPDVGRAPGCDRGTIVSRIPHD
jgi:hypothetical protein